MLSGMNTQTAQAQRRFPVQSILVANRSEIVIRDPRSAIHGQWSMDKGDYAKVGDTENARELITVLIEHQ
jgi:hypothetical protein